MIKVDIDSPPPVPVKPLYPRLMRGTTGTVYIAYDRNNGAAVKRSETMIIHDADFDDDKVWQPLEKGTTITITQE